MGAPWVAEGLGVAWNTANDAVLAEGKRVLIDDPGRLGDKYVTVIIDLTGIRDGTGPARVLDMVVGRSKQSFKTWLSERPKAWRNAIEVVAMDGVCSRPRRSRSGLGSHTMSSGRPGVRSGGWGLRSRRDAGWTAAGQYRLATPGSGVLIDLRRLPSAQGAQPNGHTE